MRPGGDGRRRAARLLAAALWMAGLGTPALSLADARVVTVWHAYGEEEAAGLRAAVEAFEARQDGVRVSVVHNAFGAYAAKLESAIPTGRGPDVFIDAHERISVYAALGLVEPLDPLDLRARLEFVDAHLAALEVDGELFGLPLSVKCAALYLNMGLVAEPPPSLEALAGLSGALPAGVFPLVYEAESSYWNAALLHAHGGALVDRDGGWAFEGPAAERMLAQVQGLISAGVVPEEPNGDLVRQLFVSGRAATAISGPWLAPAIPPDLRWRVVPLPPVEGAEGRPMEPYVTVEGAILARGARDRALAQAFIHFLAGAEGAAPRAREGRQIVASRSVWETHDLAADPFLSTFREAAARGRIMSTHPHQRMAFEPAERAIRKVLRGGVPAARALAEGRRRFEDVTRPPPAERDPTMALVVLGLLLLLVTGLAVRKARDAQVRSALRASLPAYRYVAHAFVAVGLLVIAPLAVGALASFFGGRGTELHYVGFANYVDIVTARGGELFASGSFWLVLLVTVLWTVLNVALHVVIGVGLALVLHRPAMRLKAPYRVLLILPWAVPNYVTALSWKGMFHRQFGAVNAILEGLGAEPVSFFAQWSTAFAANLATNVWLGFPFMMVVTLGALSAIPKDLYEAAAVDGATAWQRFRLITAPLLRPMLAPAIAMGAIWTFNMFNVVFLVSGGEPDGTTEILVSEAYRWAFTRSSQYGYAAAYAVLIFGVLALGTRAVGRRLDGAGETR